MYTLNSKKFTSLSASVGPGPVPYGLCPTHKPCQWGLDPFGPGSTQPAPNIGQGTPLQAGQSWATPDQWAKAYANDEKK